MAYSSLRVSVGERFFGAQWNLNVSWRFSIRPAVARYNQIGRFEHCTHLKKRARRKICALSKPNARNTGAMFCDSQVTTRKEQDSSLVFTLGRANVPLANTLWSASAQRRDVRCRGATGQRSTWNTLREIILEIVDVCCVSSTGNWNYHEPARTRESWTVTYRCSA